ncbi:hypothetical protein [Qipengyuania sp. MTN3-11]|uniref:hypothetical protein n=1 Tax=Qipengyuania sp. MTN3-11 TaxID=3056557 RepID=UPI0036F42B37
MTRFKFASGPALLAALSLTATPSAAADIGVSVAPSPMAARALDLGWSPADEVNDGYRRYRHRHGGVDAGDVIAGVLILGGIAAVASAASRSDERRDDYRYPARYPDARGDARYPSQDARGINRAVSICVDAIERDVRVSQVDNVDRTAAGWRVSGTLYDGEGFDCRIGSDGRIEDIDYSARADGWSEGVTYEPYAGAGSVAPNAGNQYDDDRYRAAWADVDARGAAVADGPLPPYPGGPLPGDLDDSQIGTDYPGTDR